MPINIKNIYQTYSFNINNFLKWYITQKSNIAIQISFPTFLWSKGKSFLPLKTYFAFKVFKKSFTPFKINTILSFKFKKFRFILFSGLGYKKKYFKKRNLIFTYIADRHWILLKLKTPQTVFPIKRRNFMILAQNKSEFNNLYAFFSSLRKPYVYKMKGFIDARVKRRFLFVRRIKIKGVKAKLSKKQMML